MRKLSAPLVIVLLAGLLMVSSFLVSGLFSSNIEGMAADATQALDKRVEESQQVLAQLSQDGDGLSEKQRYALFSTERMGLYLWSGDSLLSWNNAQIPIPPAPSTFSTPLGMIKLQQGYYLYVLQRTGNQTSLALSRIRSAYNLQNNYLKNNFMSWTGIPEDAAIGFSMRNGTPVSLGGKALFYISGDADYLPAWAANLATVLFLTAFLLLQIAALFVIRRRVSDGVATVVLVAILLLRASFSWLQWPAFFHRSLLYDLQLFGNAASLFNFFLGDLLLNGFTLLFVAAAFHFHFRTITNRAGRLKALLLLGAFCVISVSQFNHSLLSLVTNSTLDFDFLNIFNIRPATLVGVFVLACCAMGLYVATRRYILLSGESVAARIGALTALSLGVCLVQLLLGHRDFFAWWFLLFALSVLLLSRAAYSSLSIGLGLQVLLMSFITSVLFIGQIGNRQRQNLAVLSAKLAERQDPILENEFAGLPARIAADESLENLIRILPDTRKEVEQLLRQRYFSEYFNRYHVELSLFDSLCHPLLLPQDPVLLNEGFFEDRIHSESDSTGVSGLYFIRNFRNNSRYIGRIRLREKRLYVFMEPKQFEEQGSFPDLLLDQSQQKQEFRNFSYAVYRNGRSTNRYGDFNYPFFLPDSASLAQAAPDFNHYFFEDDGTTQIITDRKRSGTDHFTYNSYLFLFFSLMAYACYFIYAAVFTTRFSSPSLARRIQSIIIVLLLVVMSAVGVTSGILVSEQFETDNRKQLQEKTGIILNELNAEFRPDEIFEPGQRENVGIRLNAFAHLFDAVITLFDRNGRLYSTSQPRLYELGLAAPLANPQAFAALRRNSASAESVNERAGNLSYLSLYTPIYNSQKELLGFINLPYFARQSDLVNELSGIISALINVYIILFVLSIVAGLILSGYITQPLQLIKQQIANIRLGRQNEKIRWESNDEIGRLVQEYNQMLVKLEESATLLARSEREGAWREMAKQVAHEIKNPLTPMKLNLQYLQHLMKNNPADFREKFEQASAGIIEQIDALAGIASAFSNFAQLPAAQLSSVLLDDVVSGALSIIEPYKDIRVENGVSGSGLRIHADREQCLRVFNNLLKNAVQALDGAEHPRISITYTVAGNRVRVALSDNGPGIPKAMQARIFSPNFTTKSTGSGLGLAMVRNIMEGFGGQVGFQSEEGRGATFWLEFERTDG